MSITKLFRGATRYIPENDETKWGTELTQLLVDIVDWCNANETFWANVKDEDYGALGDGFTDDTASIQEALDEIETAGGGIVYIPSGTYVVTSISVGDNVTLLTSGPSTIIQQKSGQPVGTRVIYVVGSNVRIGDIYIKGNIATDTQEHNHGIFVQGTSGSISNITLGNIYGENIRGDVVYLGGTTTYPLYNVKIESIYGTNIFRDICTLTGGQNIQIGSISGSQIGFYTFNTEPNPSSQACTDIKIGIIKGHGVCLLGYQSTVLIERVIIDHLDLSSAYSVGSTPQYPAISHPFHTALQLRCCRGITVNKFKANAYSSFGVRVIWETNDVETTDVEFGYIDFVDCSKTEAVYTASMLLVKSDNVTIKGGRVEQYDNTRFFIYGDNTATVHFYNIDFTPSGNDLGRIINECGPGSIFYNIKANTTTDTYPFYYISKCKISNCNITHGRLLGYSHNVLIENSTITITGVLFNAGYGDNQIINSFINSTYVSGPGYFIDVKSYGAAGNGTTDDTAAIQEAITAASGGVVFFPAGTYKITSALTSTGKVILRGVGAHDAGSILRSYQTDANPLLKFDGASYSEWITIENLRFYGNGASHTGGAIYFDNPFHLSINKCAITNFGGIGIESIINTNSNEQCTISDCHIFYNFKGGVKLNGVSGGCYHFLIQNCIINENGYYGVYLAEAYSTKIDCCSFGHYYYGGTPGGPTHQPVPIVLNNDKFTTISNCRFENNGGTTGVSAYNIRTGYDGDSQANAANTTRELIIENNEFTPVQLNGRDLTHIRLHYFKGVTILGNYFEHSNSYSGTYYGIEFGTLFNNPENRILLLNNEWESTLTRYNGTTPAFILHGDKNWVTGTVAPVSGTWAKGDICWNSDPDSTEQIGWVCTVAGTPGTWKGFGTIAS